jgi:hypothetical protein
MLGNQALRECADAAHWYIASDIAFEMSANVIGNAIGARKYDSEFDAEIDRSAEFAHCGIRKSMYVLRTQR